jgi:hypothetical protein
VPTDYRRVRIEVCRADLVLLRRIVDFAAHESAYRDPEMSVRCEVAEGFLAALEAAYDAAVDDGHDEVDEHEYAAAERHFVRSEADVVRKRRLHKGVVAAVYVDGYIKHDCYVFASSATGWVWVDIPDLIGRAAFLGGEA